MAKKRFKDNLFGLFEEETPRAEAPASTPAEAKPSPTPSVAEDETTFDIEVPTKTPRARRKASGKGFTQGLDSFLNDSFERENALPAPASSATSTAPAAAPRTPRRRRRSGLDLLIRSTVPDEDRNVSAPKAADTKRVTLIFKKDHLLELKEQAKERGMYLKDVVQEMVAGYLDK